MLFNWTIYMKIARMKSKLPHFSACEMGKDHITSTDGTMNSKTSKAKPSLSPVIFHVCMEISGDKASLPLSSHIFCGCALTIRSSRGGVIKILTCFLSRCISQNSYVRRLTSRWEHFASHSVSKYSI